MTTLQLQAAQVQFGARRLQHRMLRDAAYRHWLMEQHLYSCLAEAAVLFHNAALKITSTVPLAPRRRN